MVWGKPFDSFPSLFALVHSKESQIADMWETMVEVDRWGGTLVLPNQYRQQDNDQGIRFSLVFLEGKEFLGA